MDIWKNENKNSSLFPFFPCFVKKICFLKFNFGSFGPPNTSQYHVVFWFYKEFSAWWKKCI